jgi:hypothetical protein
MSEQSTWSQPQITDRRYLIHVLTLQSSPAINFNIAAWERQHSNLIIVTAPPEVRHWRIALYSGRHCRWIVLMQLPSSIYYQWSLVLDQQLAIASLSWRCLRFILVRMASRPNTGNRVFFGVVERILGLNSSIDFVILVDDTAVELAMIKTHQYQHHQIGGLGWQSYSPLPDWSRDFRPKVS